jgi:hypothetical protein
MPVIAAGVVPRVWPQLSWLIELCPRAVQDAVDLASALFGANGWRYALLPTAMVYQLSGYGRKIIINERVFCVYT